MKTSKMLVFFLITFAPITAMAETINLSLTNLKGPIRYTSEGVLTAENANKRATFAVNGTLLTEKNSVCFLIRVRGSFGSGLDTALISTTGGNWTLEINRGGYLQAGVRCIYSPRN